MTEEQPIWRIAIKDADHPLHRVAWTIFSPKMNTEKAAKRLEPQKDEIIPFLLLVFENEDLSDAGSFGDGMAPLHAADLLATWHVEAMLPRLFAVLTDDIHRDYTTLLWDRTVRYLPYFGPQIIPRLLELVDKEPDELPLYMSLAAEAEPGNEDVYQRTQAAFEAETHPLDKEYLLNTLFVADRERTITYLQDHLKQRKYPRDIREMIKRSLKYELENRS